jgi:radical SAM superfamily enzyme YgiQ (UPF0313 family)
MEPPRAEARGSLLPRPFGAESRPTPSSACPAPKSFVWRDPALRERPRFWSVGINKRNMGYGKKKRIYLADLSYFNRYSSSTISIPLNIGYVCVYLVKLYGREIEVSLFKDPRTLISVCRMNPPDVLGLSCYFWNMHLDTLVAKRVKQINPRCITVIGGPHVDTDQEEQLDLYRSFNGCLDFLVQNEGELGFSKIIERLLSGDGDELFSKEIDGCTFFSEGDRPICGKDIGLSINLTELSSPFLSGILDGFLKQDFLPIIQTSRMCPYSCSYCCSGKLKGKIRQFPLGVVKEEIAYIAKRYKDAPHRFLYLSDENFGINEQDAVIAEYLVQARDKFGYPQQITCYFDKKLSPTVKSATLLLAKMNSGGFQLAFQSFNDDALKAVKRKNMSDEEIKVAVEWAHSKGIKTFSELIFGFPYETKESFLKALEFCMQSGIDTIAAHNLFLLKGIELNRQPERRRFGLQTKFRPARATDYDIIDNEFVCESEEVVVSSDYFSFHDFMDIRKISLIFYVVNANEYFKKVFSYLISLGKKVIPLFDVIMNPAENGSRVGEYLRFVNDFIKDAGSELFDSHEDIHNKLKTQFLNHGNEVAAPARLNVSYSARLIYNEKWFAKVLLSLAKDLELHSREFRIFRDLSAISENEWIDIRRPERGKQVVVAKDTLEYLGVKIPKPEASEYRLKMTPSMQQVEKIKKYNEQFASSDDSYFFNIIDVIQPRSQLRYECIEVEGCDSVLSGIYHSPIGQKAKA